MLINMLLPYIFVFVFVSVSGRAHFRSVLLERACLKRPSLDFCPTHTSSTTTTPTTTTTTTTVPTTPLMLVPPPIVVPIVTEVPAPAGNHTKNHINDDDLGTLLRLPKPLNVSHTEEKAVDPFDDTVAETNHTTSVPHGHGSHHGPTEDEKTVLVYISEYCVVKREQFVTKCHGEVEDTDLPFCKAYPPACASAPGVLPVISYCQRYYKQYPKHCTVQDIPKTIIQFCYAFEQFCLPELTPAKPPTEVVEKEPQPKPALKRCEDVVDEARKICNPFPRPKDTFNVIRCTNFLTNCREFIDWD